MGRYYFTMDHYFTLSMYVREQFLLLQRLRLEVKLDFFRVNGIILVVKLTFFLIFKKYFFGFIAFGGTELFFVFVPFFQIHSGVITKFCMHSLQNLVTKSCLKAIHNSVPLDGRFIRR